MVMADMERANEVNFSKKKKTQFPTFQFNCLLLIFFANILDSDQAHKLLNTDGISERII